MDSRKSHIHCISKVQKQCSSKIPELLLLLVVLFYLQASKLGDDHIIRTGLKTRMRSRVAQMFYTTETWNMKCDEGDEYRSTESEKKKNCVINP